MLTRRNFITASLALASAHGEQVRAQSGAAPFKLFDGHLHLVADDEQRYPRLPSSGTTAGLPGVAALPAGIGGQSAGIGAAPARALTDVERVVRWMDEQGVAAAAAVQKKGTYGFDNSYILDSSDKYRDRFMPIVVLDAEDPKAPGLVRDLVRSRTIAGVRLTGGMSADKTFPWLSSAPALKTWGVLDELRLVGDVMITEQGRPPEGIAQINRLARDFPNVRIVLDHAGFPIPTAKPTYGIDRIHASLAAQRNVFYKFTTINLDLLRASHLAPEDFVRRLVDVYGANHVLWGSDAGNSGGSYAELVPRVVASASRLTEAEKRQVLLDTGARVFVRGGLHA